ncbi:MAG: phytanoyl-CoA dioxygenase family protein [Actinobacteria bacterium]|nr:phytanoyl-CoA dioxygenase family protein [Actinomycetota bacterium]
MSDHQLDRAAGEIERDGVTILRGLFPRELVQDWANAFDAMVEHRRRQPRGLAARGKGRFYTTLPWMAPFADSGVFAHPSILELVRRVLGDKIAMVQLAADTPVLGSEAQEVHRDFPPLFADDVFTPLFALAVNFPLCDVTEENGPFKMARGTHLLRRAEADARVASGDIPLESFPMTMGDVMVRTPFALHAGSPNTTPAPRPMVVMGYVREWLHTPNLELTVPRHYYESLPEPVRGLLRCRVVDQLQEQPETYVHFKH